MKCKMLALLITVSICCGIISAQDGEDKLAKYFENLDHKLNAIEKLADDILWYHKVGDVARIDKVYMTGPPLWKEKNPTALGAGDPVKFWSCKQYPVHFQGADPAKELPVLLLRRRSQLRHIPQN